MPLSQHAITWEIEKKIKWLALLKCSSKAFKPVGFYFLIFSNTTQFGRNTAQLKQTIRLHRYRQGLNSEIHIVFLNWDFREVNVQFVYQGAIWLVIPFHLLRNKRIWNYWTQQTRNQIQIYKIAWLSTKTVLCNVQSVLLYMWQS